MSTKYQRRLDPEKGVNKSCQNVFMSAGPVLGRFERLDQIGPRTLRGPALVGVPFCTVRYKIGESAKS